MTTWSYETKNIPTWTNSDRKSGIAWLYNQIGITYDDTNAILYNSDGMTTSWTNETKNTSSYSYQTKN